MEVDPSRKVELVLRLVARYFSIFARLSISDGSLVDERILVNHHNVRAGNPPFSSSPTSFFSFCILLRCIQTRLPLLTLSQIYSDLPFFKIFFSITWRKNWGNERALCGNNLFFFLNNLASHLLERYLELLYKAFWKWLIPTVVVEEKSGQAFLLDSQRTIQVASMLMHFIVTLGREKKYSSSLKMSVNRCQLWFHQLSKSRGGTGSVSTYFKNMNCSDTLSVGVLAFNFQVILILNDIHHLI